MWKALFTCVVYTNTIYQSSACCQHLGTPHSGMGTAYWRRQDWKRENCKFIRAFVCSTCHLKKILRAGEICLLLSPPQNHISLPDFGTSEAFQAEQECYTILYYTTLHYTTLHYTTLHYTTLRYATLHYAMLHYTMLHYTILYYTILDTMLYCIVLYYAILYNSYVMKLSAARFLRSW